MIQRQEHDLNMCALSRLCEFDDAGDPLPRVISLNVAVLIYGPGHVLARHERLEADRH